MKSHFFSIIAVLFLSSCNSTTHCKADGKVSEWTGKCVDGLAEGKGTATFEGEYKKSIQGIFNKGEAIGHVEILYSRGGSYVGGIKNGHFHGKGTWNTDTGYSYIGAWDQGHLVGDGIYVHEDGRRTPVKWKKIYGLIQARYFDENTDCEIWFAPNRQFPRGKASWSGDCKDGKAHGQGTLKWNEGIKGQPKSHIVSFKGRLVNGRLSGPGQWNEIQYYANLTRQIEIDAIWQESLISGPGNYVEKVEYIDRGYFREMSRSYMGQFLENKFHGPGRLLKTEIKQNEEMTETTYEGEFKSGNLHGEGIESSKTLLREKVLSEGYAQGKFEDWIFTGFGEASYKLYEPIEDFENFPIQRKSFYPNSIYDGGTTDITYPNGDTYSGQIFDNTNELAVGICHIKSSNYNGDCKEKIMQETKYGQRKCLVPPENENLCLIETESFGVD